MNQFLGYFLVLLAMLALAVAFGLGLHALIPSTEGAEFLAYPA